MQKITESGPTRRSVVKWLGSLGPTAATLDLLSKPAVAQTGHTENLVVKLNNAKPGDWVDVEEIEKKSVPQEYIREMRNLVESNSLGAEHGLVFSKKYNRCYFIIGKTNQPVLLPSQGYIPASFARPDPNNTQEPSHKDGTPVLLNLITSVNEDDPTNTIIKFGLGPRELIMGSKDFETVRLADAVYLRRMKLNNSNGPIVISNGSMSNLTALLRDLNWPNSKILVAVVD